MSRKRPNILFLMNDHQAYYRHGWDGGPSPQRPYFERLARDGMRFDRAYSACPLCLPDRRSLLTGVFPHRHGFVDNGEAVKESPFDLYFGLLAEQGYRNYYFGKWHAGPGVPQDYGCEGFSCPGYGNPYLTPEYADYLRRYNLPPAEHLIERNFWQHFGGSLGEIKPGMRYRCRRPEDCREHMTGLTVTPKETHESFFVANLACEQLRELAGRDEPFAMRVDFWGPHQPYFPTAEFADRYRPETIPVYPSYSTVSDQKPALYHREINYPLFDENRRLIEPSALPWSEWQNVIARCYAQVTMIDAAGGMVLEALEQAGMARDTIVIWTTDHGDWLASHGGHFDKYCTLSEEMIRVPLAIRWPGRVAPGVTSDCLVSHVDLPVTLLDFAETGFSGAVDGQSLLPLLTGTAGAWREDLLSETHGNWGDDLIGRAVVTDRYKYAVNEHDLSELYDLRADPYELHNLIADKACQPVVEDLSQRLENWVETTDDSIFLERLGGRGSGAPTP
jgi:arylsulfatase A-like enzyme